MLHAEGDNHFESGEPFYSMPLKNAIQKSNNVLDRSTGFCHADQKLRKIAFACIRHKNIYKVPIIFTKMKTIFVQIHFS